VPDEEDLSEAKAFVPESRLRRWFGPDTGPSRLWPRWIFLRALGVIYFSAFYSLAFQIHGMIGPRGILPAREYFRQVGAFDAPSLLRLSSGDAALWILVGAGLVASLGLVANVWPRAMLVVCGLAFLSFVTATDEFSSYQSDGMLLEAGLLSLFFAPPGFRPGLGAAHPPSVASRLLLVWEWFRIYFESGVVKLLSGDPQWRHLTAMDHYYENGPLPTWLGWYVQQGLPRGFHAATAFATLALELVVCWLAFLPRRLRIACFCIVTPFQIGIIFTANYTFLNYLVLFLGVLLLDDAFLARFRLRAPEAVPIAAPPAWRLAGAAVMLPWILYSTLIVVPGLPGQKIPDLFFLPAEILLPFRVANRYGLFAVMTEERDEIEFEGSRDGEHWKTYRFRYKPQDPKEAPGIYAPYQPRFEWNLWFASLGGWRQSPFVLAAEVRLLENEPSVLRLFRGNPFRGRPPRFVRARFWRYWFTTPAQKRRTGRWWNREPLGLFGPPLERMPNGRIRAVRE
jgi:hypothetical protein